LVLGGLVRLWLRRLRYRFGIDVPASTRVGPGLYINHPGGSVVHSEAVIGRNCNLSHDVTVGEANRAPRKGFPVIGDGVFLGPGAKVIGRVHIGDDVAVGANAVGHRRRPRRLGRGRRAGARHLARRAVGYINHTDY
jgi:serine O-acetyltransferase